MTFLTIYQIFHTFIRRLYRPELRLFWLRKEQNDDDFMTQRGINMK